MGAWLKASETTIKPIAKNISNFPFNLTPPS